MPALADEVIAAIRDRVPAYRRPLRGRFGAGIRAGVEEALRPVRRADRRSEPRPQRRRARLPRARAGRAPRAALARRAARGLPAGRPGRLAAGRRDRDRRPASTGGRWRCSPRRCSPTSTSSRRCRRRATRRSSRSPPGRRSGAAGESPRLLLDPIRPTRGVAARRPTRRAGRCRGPSPRSSGRPGAAPRPRLPAAALVVEERRPAAGTALIADPDAPGVRARLERAAAQTTAALGPTVATARRRAPARAARASLLGAGAATASSTAPACSSRRAPGGARHARRPRGPGATRRAPAGAARRGDAGLARATDRDTSLLARPSGRGRAGRRRAARPPADGALPARGACASCSARRSTTRRGGSSWRWRCEARFRRTRGRETELTPRRRQ